MSRVFRSGVYKHPATFHRFGHRKIATFRTVPALWVYPPLCHGANPSEGRTDGTMDEGPFRTDAAAEPEPGRGDPAAGATAVPSDAERGSGADSLLGS